MKTTLNLIDVNFWQAGGLLTLLCAATIAPAQTHDQFLVNTSSPPTSIAKGSDGNLWFTEHDSAKIGCMTPGGKIIEYTLPDIYSKPRQIIAGPGGELWFTDTGRIGKITTSGVITEFPVSGGLGFDGLTVGPDGNLWFTDAHNNLIWKMTPSGTVTEFGGLVTNSGVYAIVTGGDGNLWFTEPTANKIGRMTLSGTVTEFDVVTHGALGFANSNAVAGPDGRVWFSESNGDRIGAITMAGTVTEYPVTAGAIPLGVSVGQDNNIWFTEYGGNKIGRMVTKGASVGSFTEVSTPTSDSQPTAIAPGPDSALYFVEGNGASYAVQIARIPVSGGAISEFPVYVPGANIYNILHITAGPDGNLWFTEEATNRIGRISPKGAITEFVLPYHGTGVFLNNYSSGLNDITNGLDGNFWFTEAAKGAHGNRIGRISPAGDLAEFDIATTNSQPAGITVGPDNNLWFVESNAGANKAAKITTSGVITEYPLTGATSGPEGITTGSDGNLWITQPGENKLARITTDGALTEFNIGASAHEITRGADDNLWLTEGSNLARVTTPTMGLLSYMTFPLPNSSNGITSAGKNLWITETSDDKIARITLDGSYDDFSLPKGSSPFDIVLGPDGRLWIAELGAIGKFTPDKIFSDGFEP